MNLRETKTHCREVMIKFTCFRCGKEHIEPMSTYKNNTETYGYLSDYKPPKPWVELIHGPVLCDECFLKYEKFMNNQEVE